MYLIRLFMILFGGGCYRPISGSRKKRNSFQKTFIFSAVSLCLSVYPGPPYGLTPLFTLIFQYWHSYILRIKIKDLQQKLNCLKNDLQNNLSFCQMGKII